MKKLMVLKGMTGAPPVEDTATGNPLKFTTDLAKPLRSLLIPFSPRQSGTGDPSPQNIRPIVPWNGLKVVHLDENLLSINRGSAQTSNGVTFTPIKQDNKTVAIHVEGICSANNTFFNLNYVNMTTLSIPKGEYKISGYTDNVGLRAFYFDSNGTERVAYDSQARPTELCIIPDDAQASWIRLQLDAGQNYINENVYPIIHAVNSTLTETDISFPSPVYGGTLDVVSGVLTVEWGAKIFDGSADEGWERRPQGSASAFAMKATISGIKDISNVTSIKANYLKTLSANETWGNYDNWISQIGDIIVTGIQSITTVEAWTAYLAENPLIVVYEFATPQEQTLTGYQITALVGNNTIWSDTDKGMTAVYLRKR